MNFKLLLLLLLGLLGAALADHPSDNCDFDAVTQACGAECAPSGTCEFDTCRMCCEIRDCPDHFQLVCDQNGSYPYAGGNHCDPLNDACDTEVCTAHALAVGFLALSTI